MEKIIEAWNNGAIIECKRKNNKTDNWIRLFTISECNRIKWNPEVYKYRIAQYNKYLIK